jgi:hypothetical protein
MAAEWSDEPLLVSSNDSSDGSENPFDAWMNDDDGSLRLEDAEETTGRGLRSIDDALLNENLAR